METDDCELRDELVRRAAHDQNARHALNSFTSSAGSAIGNIPEELEAMSELERVER